MVFKRFFTFFALMFFTVSAFAAGEFTVHTYSAPASGIFVNAYIVETEQSLIVIDATLTVSDARAVRAKVDALGKPLGAVLLTHGHPDHYNGVTDLLQGMSGVPVVAVAGVDRVIRDFDNLKESQWKPMFKDEWPARRTFPTRIVADGDSISFDGVRFVVHDLGAGESHHDSYWTATGPSQKAAFIGDVVIHRMHAYLSDGHSTAWIRNLERLRADLRDAGVRVLYPGHGPSGGPGMLDWQRGYLERYRAAVAQIGKGRSALSEDEKRRLAETMHRYLPVEHLAFLIPLGADAVAAELAPKR